MLRFCFFLCFFEISLFCGGLQGSERTFVDRVLLHLLLEDAQQAVNEIKEGLSIHADSKDLNSLLIQAYMANHEERAALSAWAHYCQSFDSKRQDFHLLEEVAWSILQEGWRHPSVSVRLHALLGAVFTKDARSIEWIKEAIRHRNIMLRSVAVELSPLMRDKPLQNAVHECLCNDSSWEVRVQALKALGRMRVEPAKESIRSVLQDQERSFEERWASVQSFVELSQGIDQEELLTLVANERSDFRMLACELVTSLNLVQILESLRPLLYDHSSAVRVAALKTFGLLGGQVLEDDLQELLMDEDPLLLSASAWYMLVKNLTEGEQIYADLLSDERLNVRWLASASLASTGGSSVEFCKKFFENSDDLFVRANLALGLIGQRVEVEKACEALFQLLKSDEILMFSEEGNGLFTVLLPYSPHHGIVVQRPEVTDQLVRLSLLNLLAIFQYPHAFEALRDLLNEKEWLVSGIASQLLLKEGDESVFYLLRDLLKDDEPHVRVQAALALAVWGRDRTSIQILHSAYEDADRNLKAHILEALGFVGKEESYDFLIDKFSEPFQTLRIIAASSLIQCLNS